MKNISDACNLNDTFWSSKNEFPSKVEGIAWCSAFALEALITVLGNLLTIILFLVNKNLRKKCLPLVINMAFQCRTVVRGCVSTSLHLLPRRLLSAVDREVEHNFVYVLQCQ